MPNVDDHGLEVLKKAARNIDVVPKKDYALQVIVVADESASGTPFTPVVNSHNIVNAATEYALALPVGTKSFILRARKTSRLRLAFNPGETNTNWVTIPLGGYWIESKRLSGSSVYIQSNIANNIIEVISYT